MRITQPTMTPFERRESRLFRVAQSIMNNKKTTEQKLDLLEQTETSNKFQHATKQERVELLEEIAKKISRQAKEFNLRTKATFEKFDITTG